MLAGFGLGGLGLGEVGGGPAFACLRRGRDLCQRNPDWLGPDMIEEVKDTVDTRPSSGF